MWKMVSIVALGLSASAVGARAASDIEVGTSFPAGYFAPFHPSSALDMIRRLPGFSFNPGDPTRRGMAEAAGNVVLEGKRVADKAFTLDEVLERIPASQVERIELVRGGASGVDMLGQSVVANVIRRAEGQGAAVTVAASAYADGRLAPGVTVETSRRSAGGASLSASASLSRYVEVNKGDGTRLRTDGAGRRLEEARVNTAAGGATGYVQAAAELAALGGQLRINGALTWTDYRDHQEDRAFYPGPVVTRLDENLGGVGGGQAGFETGAHLARRLGGGLDSETTVSGRVGRKRYRSVLAAPGARTTFGEHDRSVEVLARTQVRYHAATRLTVALDVEGAYNSLDTKSALAFNDYAIPLPDGDAEVTETRGDAGVVMIWQATPRLELQGGLHEEVSRIDARSDADLTATYRFLKPSLHVNWSLSSGRRLRLRGERDVDQLDFGNFVAAASLDKGVVSAGNTALRPQSAWIAEVAYEWRSASNVSAVLTYRHSWLRDVIDRVPVVAYGSTLASFDAPGNIGSGREDLVSLDATIPLGRDRKTRELKLSMTYRHARVSDPTTGASRQTSRLKPFVLTADYHHDVPRLAGAWGATLDAGWRTRTYLFNEVDTDKAGALLTVFANWNPQPNLSVHLEASNLLDREFDRRVDAYGGSRAIAALSYSDYRQLQLGPAVTLRVRCGF